MNLQWMMYPQAATRRAVPFNGGVGLNSSAHHDLENEGGTSFAVCARMVESGEKIGPLCADVLVVEDEKTSRRALSMLLNLNGFSTVAVGSAEEAIKQFDHATWPHIALVDLDLPGMNGLDLIARLEAKGVESQIVLLTAADEERVWKGIGNRAILYLRKPVNFERLLSILEK